METRRKILLIAAIALVLDVIMKEWIFNTLVPTEVIDVAGDYFKLCHIENVGLMDGHPSIYRLVWFIIFLFLFIRVLKTQVHVLIQFGVILIFAGIFGNYMDTILFGVIQGHHYFLPWLSMDRSSVLFISTFYIDLGFISFTDNISGLMTTIGFFTLLIGIIVKFQEFRKLFKRANSSEKTSIKD
jgi:lipoprotein signal peptidase